MALSALCASVHFQTLVPLLYNIHERLCGAMGLPTFAWSRLLEISQDHLPSLESLPK